MLLFTTQNLTNVQDLKIDLSRQDFYSSIKTVLNRYCFWALKTLNVCKLLKLLLLKGDNLLQTACCLPLIVKCLHQFYLTKPYFHMNVINNFFPLNYWSEVVVNVHSREFDMTRCTSEASSAKLTKIPYTCDTIYHKRSLCWTCLRSLNKILG